MTTTRNNSERIAHQGRLAEERVAIMSDPIRLSEAKNQIKEFLYEPNSLALLKEIKTLTELPGERTSAEILKICQNMHMMNCLHRIRAWGLVGKNTPILTKVHEAIMELVVYTIYHELDTYQSKDPRMPVANEAGIHVLDVMLSAGSESGLELQL